MDETVQLKVFKKYIPLVLLIYGALSGSKLNVQTFSSLNFETNLFAYNYFLIAALF